MEDDEDGRRGKTCTAPPKWAPQSTLGEKEVPSVMMMEAATMPSWQFRCLLHCGGIFFLQSDRQTVRR